MSQCRSCKAPIVWVETEATAKRKARKMPVDATEAGEIVKFDDGNLLVVGTTGSLDPIVRYVKSGPKLAKSHFATCPDAASFRKKGNG